MNWLGFIRSCWALSLVGLEAGEIPLPGLPECLVTERRQPHPEEFYNKSMLLPKHLVIVLQKWLSF